MRWNGWEGIVTRMYDLTVSPLLCARAGLVSLRYSARTVSNTSFQFEQCSAGSSLELGQLEEEKDKLGYQTVGSQSPNGAETGGVAEERSGVDITTLGLYPSR
jgi:hypothetical protein